MPKGKQHVVGLSADCRRLLASLDPGQSSVCDLRQNLLLTLARRDGFKIVTRQIGNGKLRVWMVEKPAPKLVLKKRKQE